MAYIEIVRSPENLRTAAQVREWLTGENDVMRRPRVLLAGEALKIEQGAMPPAEGVHVIVPELKADTFGSVDWFRTSPADVLELLETFRTPEVHEPDDTAEYVYFSHKGDGSQWKVPVIYGRQFFRMKPSEEWQTVKVQAEAAEFRKGFAANQFVEYTPDPGAT